MESAKGIASAMKEPPPSDIVEEATLMPLLQSSISAALQAYAKQFPDDSRERKLTCVLTWGRRPCRAPQELGVEDAKVGVIWGCCGAAGQRATNTLRRLTGTGTGTGAATGTAQPCRR